MIKKCCILFVAISMIFCRMPRYVFAQEPEISCKYAILVDCESNTVMFEKDADVKTPIASITKIMTMLIAMEKLESEEIKLNDIITVSKRASDMGGSQLYLEEGEKRTVQELLYGIAIESGNDAAVALAEGIGGSYDAFITLMNEKAKQLGMNNTFFSTPCGLDDENNYSTARDVAKMSVALLEHEKIYDFINKWTVDITIGKNNDILRTLTNTNKMLTQSSNIDGIKTGYTSASGHCISVTSEKNGMRIVGIILSAPDSKTRFEEAEKIVEYGFANYEGKYFAKKDEEIGDFKVYNSQTESNSFVIHEDVYVNTQKGKGGEMTTEIIFNKTVFFAPLHKSESIGTIQFFLNGELYKQEDIFPSEDIEKCSYGQYMQNVKTIVLP